jgi:hypothetical protein
MAHVVKTESAASPSIGPPSHEVNPRNTTVATNQPKRHSNVEIGRSGHALASARVELEPLTDMVQSLHGMKSIKGHIESNPDHVFAISSCIA